MTKALTAADIDQADDITREAVAVPEWGGTVYVRVMDGTSRDKFESDNVRFGDNGKAGKASPNLVNFSARLAALTVCDEAGTLLFNGADAVARLAKKAGTALERIVRVAMRINGMGGQALEQAVGNSSPAPNGSSITDSQLISVTGQ